MTTHPLSFVFLALAAACSSAPEQSGQQPPGQQAPGQQTPKVEVAGARDEAAREKELADLQKELRHKQRDLGYAEVEQQNAAIDRRLQQLGTEAALLRTADELAEARNELRDYQEKVQPRELEEKRISLDRSVHRADHAKDELAELTAMYEADEFAKATKELVLKRGRRELEMAERSLAVARQELEHHENVAVPKRVRELQRKVVDAERERKKAELEAEKQQREAELAARKAADRIAELRTEIDELGRKLEKAAK